MEVVKANFAWGKGCFMRCMGSCDVIWDGGKKQKNRKTIINGDGLLCEPLAGEVKSARVRLVFLSRSYSK